MADGTLIASNTLTLRVLTLAHAGEYSCEAINSVGGGRSPPILVRMKCKCLREFVSLSIIIVLIIIIIIFFGFQMPRDAGRATRGARSQPAVTKRCRCVARSTRFPGTASGSRGRTTGRSVTCCQCQTRKLGTTGSLAFSSTLPPLTPTSELSRAGRATASEDKGRLVYSTSWLEVRVLDNSKLTLFLNGLFFLARSVFSTGILKRLFIYIFSVYIFGRFNTRFFF